MLGVASRLFQVSNHISYINMRKKLLLATVALLLTTMAYAVPVKPGVKRTVTLADGRTVQLTLQGDEHFSYFTTDEGAPCLLKDNALKMLTHQEVAELWTANKQQRLSIDSRRSARRAGTPGHTTGKQHGLVILVEFTDVKFKTEAPQATFQRFFNEEGYNDFGMAGSVKDYFKKQSYGQLEIDFDVVGPYTVANDMAYYGKHYTDAQGNEQHDSHPAQMAREAVDAATVDVDFSNYDWNDDGEVDQVFIIYAGYAEAQGAAPETIWPHEWVLAAEDKKVRYNNVVINTYGCASELAGDGKTWGGDLCGIGTACHEFSHCLGLPDMYDTEGQRYFGMSYWDIMDAGSYNDDGRTPAGYTSYERWFSKWMEPIELNTMTRITDMQPLQEKPEAYILYNDKNRNEYYLLENRQPIGYDKKLFGHGLLILHVDYNEDIWRSNKVNTSASHQRMTIIPADNELRASTTSLAGDPWPGNRENTMLTNFTTPAATLYNPNVDGRQLMSKAIDNITENPQTMTISFVACRPELQAPSMDQVVGKEGAEGTYELSWTAVEGAIGYELELTATPKAATTPEEALKVEHTFDKFLSAKAGLSDVSSKLTEYGLSGWTGSKLFTSPNKMKMGTATTNGNIKTPNWYVLPSGEMTVVLGAKPYDDATPVKGNLVFSSREEADKTWTSVEEIPFQVTADGKQVFNLKGKKYAFNLNIQPGSPMYLNYFALYDGTWTAEQLGINTAAAPRRAGTVTKHTTSTNSYTFTGLSGTNSYTFRIRSLGEEGTYSDWSAEGAFEVATGIRQLHATDAQAPVRYYDLQGREVTGDVRGLVIQKQGSRVVKIAVK